MTLTFALAWWAAIFLAVVLAIVLGTFLGIAIYEWTLAYQDRRESAERVRANDAAKLREAQAATFVAWMEPWMELEFHDDRQIN